MRRAGSVVESDGAVVFSAARLRARLHVTGLLFGSSVGGGGYSSLPADRFFEERCVSNRQSASLERVARARACAYLLDGIGGFRTRSARCWRRKIKRGRAYGGDGGGICISFWVLHIKTA
jgi:hypothetical protein